MLINQRLYENIRTLRLAKPTGTCGQVFHAEAMAVIQGRFVGVKWVASLDGKKYVSTSEAFCTEMLSDVEPDIFYREIETRLERFESIWFTAMQQIDERQYKHGKKQL